MTTYEFQDGTSMEAGDQRVKQGDYGGTTYLVFGGVRPTDYELVPEDPKKPEGRKIVVRPGTREPLRLDSIARMDVQPGDRLVGIAVNGDVSATPDRIVILNVVTRISDDDEAHA